MKSFISLELSFHIRVRRVIEKVVDGRVGVIIVGKKTRQVYYVKDRIAFATDLDTKVTPGARSPGFPGGLTGIAARKCVELKRPVRITELIRH